MMAGLLRDKPATVFVPDTVGVAVGQGGLVDPAVRALRSFQTAHGWKLSLARSYRTGGGRSLVNRILTNPEMERPFAVARCIFAVFNSEGAHHDESDSVPASIPNGNFSFTQSSVQPPREVGHTGIYLRTKLLM